MKRTLRRAAIGALFGACSTASVNAAIVDPVDVTFPSPPAAQLPADLNAMAVHTDGRVFVASSPLASGGGTCPINTVTAMTPDGALDARFGNGGVARLQLPDIACANSYDDVALAVSDAGIVFWVWRGFTQYVGRLLFDGRLDTSFAGGGIYTVPATATVAAARIAVTSDGSIVVAGLRNAGRPAVVAETGVEVFRLRPDGTLDTQFGSGGVALSYVPGHPAQTYSVGLAAYPDGAVVVAAPLVLNPDAPGTRTEVTAGLFRFLAGGSRDTDFGDGGVAWGPQWDDLYPHGVAAFGQGAVVVNGVRNASNVAAVLAVDERGVPLASFGQAGRTLVPAVYTFERYPQIVTDRQQRIYVAGRTEGGFRVARLTSDGALDPSFGIGGSALVYAGYPFGFSAELAVDGADRMHLGLWGERGRPGSTFTVLRLKADGGHVDGLSAAIAIEYYHAGLDHYFVTADPFEQQQLDAGRFAGWQRSGYSFPVAIAAAPSAPLSPVCRFYGRPEAGLDSHFYSASPAECAEVERRLGSAWMLESSNVFGVELADPLTGACSPATEPIWRLFNNRRDVNHRYVSDFGRVLQMRSAGWISEGYGNDGVAFCAPWL